MSRALIAAALVVLLVAAVPRPADAAPSGTPPRTTPTVPTPNSDPFRLGWPAYTPVVPGDARASTEAGCTPGSTACVDNVVAEMQRRVASLGCSHDGVFGYVYLRTTQQYRQAVTDPAFFRDNAFVNHEDAVFADTYFRAQDGFRAGTLAEVPPAWRIAFHVASIRKVTSLGNMLLGMSAHINRDLPFVLNAIGLVDANGVSRKPDHDRVNDILAVVNRYALYEVSQRYDPTAGDGRSAATTMDYHALQNTVTRWREQAWTNATALAAARTPDARLTVARSIEAQAAATALGLQTSYAYGPGETSTPRDAYCAAHAAS
jgi:hypothetical protein